MTPAPSATQRDVLDALGGAHAARVRRARVVGVVADEHDPRAGRAGADRRRGADEVERALARLDAPDEADDRAAAVARPTAARRGGTSSSTGQ